MRLLTLLLLLSHRVVAQFDMGSILTAQTTYCKNNLYNWPECIDTPTGYRCICGPGFYWNTKTCIADAVDSRLEFPEPIKVGNETEFAYTLLLGKPFPALGRFTMSVFLKPDSVERRQAVFSYKYISQDGNGEDQTSSFALFIGPVIDLEIANQTKGVPNNGHIKAGVWSHLIVTWFSDSASSSTNHEQDGYFEFRVNDRRIKQGFGLSRKHTIESGGDMVLGQYVADSQNKYNLTLGYIGSLAHMNIWDSMVMSRAQISTLSEDCTLTHCGDGVEWVDLRVGTRGISRLRWPSGLGFSGRSCFTAEQSLETCDKYCSFVIGVQCKEEIQESIVWARTPAATDDGSLAVLHVACPGQEKLVNSSNIAKANRTCTSSQDKVGVWGPPQVEHCLSEFYLSFNRKVGSYMLGKSFDKDFIISLLDKLRNHTRSWVHSNPVDISAATSSLSKLLQFQTELLGNSLIRKDTTQVEYLSRDQPSLTYQESLKIADLHIETIDHLLNRRNDGGWNVSKPAGQEADELLQVVDSMTYMVALSLKYHLLSGDITDNTATYRKVLENIEVKVNVYRRTEFHGLTFPDITDKLGHNVAEDSGVMTFVMDTAANPDAAGSYLPVVVVRLPSVSRLLIDPRYGNTANINTAVFSLRTFNPSLDNTSVIRMMLPYTDNFNISNPACVSIVHGNSSGNALWDRTQSLCQLISNNTDHVVCECKGEGFFTAVTDMFNVNWRVPEPPPELMVLPSYLGCSISIFLSICTLGMLIYVGTSSRTALIHKHFAVAVTCNTATFMIGITLTYNETLCKTFAILFHYFFLSMYAWIMNEAFNLYISITYTAHNQPTQTESGYWKYYVIGWGIPGVLVAALVGSNFDTYFSDSMCWVSWQNIWLFAAPPLAMITVSLLVMTFAVKENHEVSYTKNESANKMTEYHSNAVWTQIILVTCTWALAFLSLRFRTIVFKWVFFIFNSAQGSFLFVFYFLLNEEVRSVFKTKEIKQQLGWDVTTGPAAFSGGSSEDTVPLTSQRDDSNLVNPEVREPTPTLEDLPKEDSTPIKVGKTQIELDALTETSV